MIILHFYKGGTDITSSSKEISGTRIKLYGVGSLKVDKNVDLSTRRSEKGFDVTDNANVKPTSILLNATVSDIGGGEVVGGHKNNARKSYSANYKVIEPAVGHNEDKYEFSYTSVDQNLLESMLPEQVSIPFTKDKIQIFKPTKKTVSYTYDASEMLGKATTKSTNYDITIDEEEDTVKQIRKILNDARDKGYAIKIFDSKRSDIYTNYGIKSLSFSEKSDSTFGFDINVGFVELRYGTVGTTELSSSDYADIDRQSEGSSNAPTGNVDTGEANVKDPSESIAERIHETSKKIIQKFNPYKLVESLF